jgi:hypothetical protein
MRLREERPEAAQCAGHRAGAARRHARSRFLDEGVDHKPGERRGDAEHDESGPPRLRLDQPRERGAGREHADAADAEHRTRHAGVLRRRVVAGDVDGADEEGRRAAGPDQHLGEDKHLEVRRPGRQRRAEDRERKRDERRSPHAVEVDADAHQELQGAERKVERAGEHAERLRCQPELGRELRRHDRGDGAIRLAEREGTGQCQQHRPARSAAARRGRGGRRHAASFGFVGGCIRAAGIGDPAFSALAARGRRRQREPCSACAS